MEYSVEEYDELDMNSYRVRFPIETANLSDQRLFEIVAATEDDMRDDDWRRLFIAG